MSDIQVTPETETQAEVIETTPIESIKESPKGDRHDNSQK